MRKNQANFFFIDKDNYENLQDKNVNLWEVVDLVSGNSKSDKFSLLTREFIRILNFKIGDVLLSDNGRYFSSVVSESGQSCQLNMTEQEQSYVERKIKTFLTGSTTQYCEIIPVSQGEKHAFLVVLDTGFMDFLAESKDNVKLVYLKFLSFLYKYNLDISSLMSSYIKLETNPERFAYIKTTILATLSRKS